MSDVELKVVATGARTASDDLKKLEGGLKQVDAAARKAGGGLKTLASTDLTKGVSTLTGWMGKLAAVAGLIGAASKVKSFAAQLVDIQVYGRLSADQMNKLRDRIDEVAKVSKKPAAELAEALAVMQKMRTPLGTAKELLLDMAVAAKAIGAPTKDVAKLGATMVERLGLTPAQAKLGVGMLYEQGRKGKAPLAENLPAITELMSKASTFGLRGLAGAREAGALFQMAAETGQGDDALALLANLRRRGKEFGKTGRGGVSVFDAKGNLRSIPDIMLDAMRLTKGDPTRLGKAFGRGGAYIAAQFREQYDPKTRNWKRGAQWRNFWDVNPESGGADIDEAARIRKTGNERALKTNRLSQEADRLLAKYGPDALAFASENKLAVGGGALAAYLSLKLGKRVAGRLAGGAASHAAGAASALGGVTSVFVTNWPPSMGGGAGAAPGSPAVAGAPGTAAGGPTRLGIGRGVGALAVAAQAGRLGWQMRSAKSRAEAFVGDSVRDEIARVNLASRAAMATSDAKQLRGLVVQGSLERGGSGGFFRGTGAEDAVVKTLNKMLEVLRKESKNPPAFKIYNTTGLDNLAVAATRGGG